MAEDLRDLCYHQSYHDENHSSITTSTTGFPLSTANNSYWNIDSTSMADSSHMLGHHSPYVTFNENLFQGFSDHDTIPCTFGLSSSSSSSMSSSHLFYPVKDEGKPVAAAEACGSEAQVTNNSSISSSSTEAFGDGESNKGNKKEKQVGEIQEEEEESLRKENKSKKKREKKEKLPRFAFMTKSEVDHLEDGYKWRKYGQKAVKNSPYPRSYYRCTTQKCQVKKRVERSFQDPYIVITTYEGTHNHHAPSALRGNVAGMFPSCMLKHSPLAAGSNFPPELFVHTPHIGGHGGIGSANVSSMYQQSLTPFQHMQFSDYGLLQDIVPSMFLKQEP